MPAPLFAHKREHCPYGHSLAPGMPQKMSWMPCICDPAREAAEHGRGMGHVTLWRGACSAEDHRDTRFYEPPHEVGHNRPLSGWATRSAGFRYHDLRHYFASLIIAHGADVKTVQARLRHGSAKTTLDTYGHLWPDKDESTKAVIDALVDSTFQGRAD